MPLRSWCALILVALVPAVASAQTPPDGVVVNEIMYAPSPASNEFVELYNGTESPVQLGDFAFADANRSFSAVATDDTTLAPGEHVVLARDPEEFRAAFPDTDALVPDDWDALNNGGDTVYLRHTPSDALVDSVPYSPSWGGDDGRSLERIDPRGPATASNFATSTAERGASPGRRNSTYAPDTEPPVPIFAELVASAVAEVVFSEPVRPETVGPQSFDAGGTEIERARLATSTVAHLHFADSPETVRLEIRGVRDLVGNALERTDVPLAYRPTEEVVTINEIMYAPLADDFDDQPNQVEYVEIANLSRRFLTLSGLVLTDRPTENNVADTVRVGRRRAVPPGGFALVAAAPHDASELGESQLAAAFPTVTRAADSIAFLPVDGEQIGLRNDGDRVHVHRNDGTTVADVSYAPSWHAESLVETTGTALARISPTGRATVGDNWTSSTAPSGGTPGQPNRVSLPVPADGPTPPGLEITPSPFSVDRDGVTRIQYALRTVPSLVRARIFDARGHPVRTLERADLVARSGELVWNGRDDAGDRVRIGIYVVLFEAVRPASGETIQLKETVVLARPLG